jgi:hypothetical protein
MRNILARRDDKGVRPRLKQSWTIVVCFVTVRGTSGYSAKWGKCEIVRWNEKCSANNSARNCLVWYAWRNAAMKPSSAQYNNTDSIARAIEPLVMKWVLLMLVRYRAMTLACVLRTMMMIDIEPRVVVIMVSSMCTWGIGPRRPSTNHDRV